MQDVFGKLALHMHVCFPSELHSFCSKTVNGRYVWREGTQIDGVVDNPPANTLAPLYNQESNSTVGYVIWNDEPAESHCPEGCPSFVLGHSKGAIHPPAGSMQIPRFHHNLPCYQS